ncbi:unnamed protein product, partial [Dibothriocephalus latus]
MLPNMLNRHAELVQDIFLQKLHTDNILLLLCYSVRLIQLCLHRLLGGVDPLQQTRGVRSLSSARNL